MKRRSTSTLSASLYDKKKIFCWDFFFFFCFSCSLCLLSLAVFDLSFARSLAILSKTWFELWLISVHLCFDLSFYRTIALQFAQFCYIICTFVSARFFFCWARTLAKQFSFCFIADRFCLRFEIDTFLFYFFFNQWMKNLLEFPFFSFFIILLFWFLFVCFVQWNCWCAFTSLYLQCTHWLSCLNWFHSHPWYI